jgi:hypothetical protein
VATGEKNAKENAIIRGTADGQYEGTFFNNFVEWKGWFGDR